MERDPRLPEVAPTNEAELYCWLEAMLWLEFGAMRESSRYVRVLASERLRPGDAVRTRPDGTAERVPAEDFYAPFNDEPPLNF